MPDGWKDGLKNTKISNELREQVKDRFPFDDILAYYYNPKRKTDYVAVMKLDDNAVSYNTFKSNQEKYDKALKDGSAKTDFIKQMPGNHDKDFDKRFQFFPLHETDDHSFQFTLVGLTLEDLKIVYSISSHAVIWIHDRIFKVEVRTIAANQSNTMDKMQDTRFFLSHWVEAILSENDCEAHDMSDTNTVQNQISTIDENSSQYEYDAKESVKASESNASNNVEKETMFSKSKVVASLGKLKTKLKSVPGKDQQKDKTSSEDDNETSINYDSKPYIWRLFLIATILIFVIYLLKKIRVNIEVKIWIVIMLIIFFAPLLLLYFKPQVQQIKDIITGKSPLQTKQQQTDE
jgi:hypothetical protein